jgi:hypothetical protein
VPRPVQQERTYRAQPSCRRCAVTAIRAPDTDSRRRRPHPPCSSPIRVGRSPRWARRSRHHTGDRPVLRSSHSPACSSSRCSGTAVDRRHTSSWPPRCRDAFPGPCTMPAAPGTRRRTEACTPAPRARTVSCTSWPAQQEHQRPYRRSRAARVPSPAARHRERSTRRSRTFSDSRTLPPLETIPPDACVRPARCHSKQLSTARVRLVERAPLRPGGQDVDHRCARR